MIVERELCRDALAQDVWKLAFRGIFGTSLPSALHVAEMRRPVTIDLVGADGINSAGLEWLEQVTAALASNATVTVRVADGSRVAHILRIMKFDRFLSVGE